MMTRTSLQASDAWQRYVDRELRRGVEPKALLDVLRARGIDAARQRTLLGEAFFGRSPAEAADHEALSRVRLVRRAADTPDLVRVPTAKAQLYTWRNFLSPEDCEAVIALIDQDLRQSTTVDAFADPNVRTSRSSDIGTRGLPLIHRIDDLMSEAIGIHWSYSDQSQAQRYDVDQEYKAHHDYFTPGTRDHKVHCQHRGQRTWTFMIYLNDVEEGGATRFRKLDRSIRPERGKAVIWNNLNPDGSVNPYTLHHGMKVRAGVKYVITKWYRERGWGPMLLDPVS